MYFIHLYNNQQVFLFSFFFFAIIDASAEKSVKCEVIQSFMLLTYLEIIQACITGKVKQQAKGNAEESGPQQSNDVMLFLLSSL